MIEKKLFKNINLCVMERFYISHRTFTLFFPIENQRYTSFFIFFNFLRLPFGDTGIKNKLINYF